MGWPGISSSAVLLIINHHNIVEKKFVSMCSAKHPTTTLSGRSIFSITFPPCINIWKLWQNCITSSKPLVEVSLGEGGLPFGVNSLRNMNLFIAACWIAKSDMLLPWDPLTPPTCGLLRFRGLGWSCGLPGEGKPLEVVGLVAFWGGSLGGWVRPPLAPSVLVGWGSCFGQGQHPGW